MAYGGQVVDRGWFMLVCGGCFRLLWQAPWPVGGGGRFRSSIALFVVASSDAGIARVDCPWRMAFVSRCFRGGVVARSFKILRRELTTVWFIMAPTVREFLVKVGEGRDETCVALCRQRGFV